MQNSSYFDFSNAFIFKLELDVIGIRELVTAAEENALDLKFIDNNIIPKFLNSIPLLFILFRRKKIQEALHINSMLAENYPKSISGIKEYIYSHLTVKNKALHIFNKIKKAWNVLCS
jgi:hypothetical protein